MAVVLHQFAYSHFNEKARWVLAYKGVEHVRKNYLPGPHIRPIKKLSGQQQTPVLDLEGQIITGSANIVHALEQRYPRPGVYPGNPRLQRRALEIQSRCDAEIGPAARTVLFSALVHEADYLLNLFAGHATGAQRWWYRAKFPLAKRMIARTNGVKDPANVRIAFEIFARTLDQVAGAVEETGYLVGDAFSIADLTTAALLAPYANPDHEDMRRPTPVPKRVQDLVQPYCHHPALDWVRNVYARHRPCTENVQLEQNADGSMPAGTGG